jgi:hypothetical protein
VVEVSKRTITRTFMGSLVAFAAGLILLLGTGGLAYTQGIFLMEGPDVVGVRPTPFGWWMVALAAFAGMVVLAAMVAQLLPGSER